MVSDLISSLKATDREIADGCGVSERTVQRWKRGEGITKANERALRRFALNRISEIARKLKVLE